MRRPRSKDSNTRTLAAVKVVHTLIWLTVEIALGVVIADGIKNHRDRRTGVAALVVGAESAIYLANGARCPLTTLAESLGTDDGSVTDIFLPTWLARSLPILHVPAVAAALWLHLRQPPDPR